MESLQRSVQSALFIDDLAGPWHELAGQSARQARAYADLSDAAIQFCLTIKCLSNFALRQAVGMVRS
ncbi:transposase [Paludibacterium sp. B53371]|uniref:transposase n=1 Tax=Paludibacterium sp. B53371 TaxID=2806263 RepID=UPI001C040B40